MVSQEQAQEEGVGTGVGTRVGGEGGVEKQTLLPRFLKFNYTAGELDGRRS